MEEYRAESCTGLLVKHLFRNESENESTLSLRKDAVVAANKMENFIMI